MGWTIHHPKGLLYHDPGKAFQGYTLVSMSGGKDAFLIDMEGGSAIAGTVRGHLVRIPAGERQTC